MQGAFSSQASLWQWCAKGVRLLETLLNKYGCLKTLGLVAWEAFSSFIFLFQYLSDITEEPALEKIIQQNEFLKIF